MRMVMLLGGTVFSWFNLLPMPWSCRLGWMRFVYFLTLKSTLIVPAILRFVQEQNVTYRMGKQRGEGYESLVQLENVLAQIDAEGIPLAQVQEAVQRAEAESISPEQLGAFAARAVFEPQVAERVLKASLQTTRY